MIQYTFEIDSSEQHIFIVAQNRVKAWKSLIVEMEKQNISISKVSRISIIKERKLKGDTDEYQKRHKEENSP